MCNDDAPHAHVMLLKAKIAELQSEAVNWSQLVESCQQTSINQMHKIAELEKQRNDYKRWNMDKYHIMNDCAVELQAWNSSGVLNHIIWKLEGRSED